MASVTDHTELQRRVTFSFSLNADHRTLWALSVPPFSDEALDSEGLESLTCNGQGFKLRSVGPQGR